MATLSNGRVIAPSTLKNSRAELGKLLLTLRESKALPKCANSAHLDFLEKVQALQFNDTLEKQGFISELVFWVKDSRLPIPHESTALNALLDLHRYAWTHKSHTALAFTELIYNWNVSHTFYNIICQFIRTNLINMPKNLASWSLIVALLAKGVAWIFVEGLTFNKTVDIVDEVTLYKYVQSCLNFTNHNDNCYLTARISYLIELVISGDDLQEGASFFIPSTHLPTPSVYKNTLNSNLKNSNGGLYDYVHYVLPSFVNTELECLAFGRDYYSVNFRQFCFSLATSIKRESPQDTRLAINRFFKFIPFYFLRHHNDIPFELLLHLGKGKNIRAYQGLEQRISKKAAHLLHNLTSADGVPIQQALLYAHFKSLDLNIDLINSLLPMYRLGFGQGINCSDEEWNGITALALFLKNQSTAFLLLNYGEQRYLLGYLSHCLRDIQGYSLKGRTIASVQRAANIWYEENNRQFNSYYINGIQSWKGVSYQEWNYRGDDNHWYAIFQLTHQFQLDDESAYMSHCVRSYGSRCASGNCSIWSLRVRKDKNWVRLATIEVNSNKKIVQVKAKYNAIRECSGNCVKVKIRFY